MRSTEAAQSEAFGSQRLEMEMYPLLCLSSTQLRAPFTSNVLCESFSGGSPVAARLSIQRRDSASLGATGGCTTQQVSSAPPTGTIPQYHQKHLMLTLAFCPKDSRTPPQYSEVSREAHIQGDSAVRQARRQPIAFRQ